MAVMTLQELRNFVRTHADTDVTDAPDSSLDTYYRMAHYDITQRIDFQTGIYRRSTTASLTTTANESIYTNLADVTAGYVWNTDEVYSAFEPWDVLGVSYSGGAVNDYPLVYVTVEDGERMFASSATAEKAIAYSVLNGNIILYPTPSTSGVTYHVLCQPDLTLDVVTGAGDSPNLPEALHPAVAWYMLSQYYLAQEDTQLAGIYMQEYEMMVERYKRYNAARDFSKRVNVIGGQNVRPMGFMRFVRGALEG